MTRHTTRLCATLAATLAASGAAQAAPFQDQLVQPPSIGLPQRGSIAGALSKLSFGAADLARGAYQLPLPIEVPRERGPLLAEVIPSYSAEGELGEWGMGWGAELAIRRHRIGGDVMYDGSDGFVSPWGRLVPGDDGAWYPAGLRSKVRVVQVGGGWEATTPDGTVYTFAAADAVTTAGGTWAWMLTRVDTLLGDSTAITWTRNDSGRAFVQAVTWGGRHDGAAYRATFAYETLAKPFASYASGSKLVLDRRVREVVVGVRQSGGAYAERWRYDLGYTTSPLGPAFYLTSLRRTFASGEAEPAATWTYDFGDEQLATATLAHQPALDLFLMSAGGAGLQPDHASTTDMEQNGLTDLEHHYTHTLVRQTETGFVFEGLAPRTGAENPLCRPQASTLNKPRLLARMRGDLGDPQVVVLRKNGVGATSTLTLCDRNGLTQATVPLNGNWELSANTRLADVDLDHRPDVVRVQNGAVQVLRNFSTAGTWAFLPMPAQTLTPAVSASASWVLDFNGDGKPDIMARTSSGVLVWYGKGHGRFESVGKPYVFRTLGGAALAGIGEYQFSHGDFNGDGLSDVILSKAQQAYLYLNQGDEFRQRAVPGLASIPFSFGYPIVGDLTGSGNPEVVFVDNNKAKTIALSRPSTGLLVRADDGKGTVVSFGYRRVRPEPGIVHRYALLSEMTVASAGYDPVTYHYDYAQAVWHSLGRYLVGFGKATKTSPLVVEDVAFHNDDDVSGVIVGTTTRDERTPGFERFTANQLEPVSVRGVPFRRPLASESGVRDTSGGAPLATRVDYETYTDDGCLLSSSTTLPDAVLTQEESLAAPPALAGAVHCLPASRRLIGVHADASLDFDYAIRIERDDLGQETRIAQVGPAGDLVLQDNVYDPVTARMTSQGAPGRGTTTFHHDSLGRVTEVVAADGTIMRVTGMDPLTDALTELERDRGAGGKVRFGYAYDGLERLARTWDSFGGSSAAQPGQLFSYAFATAGAPGRIGTSVLADAATGVSRQEVDLLAADGEKLATATWAGSWIVSGLTRVERTTLTRTSYHRLPLGGAGALGNLSLAELYGVGAEALSVVVEAGFGYTAQASRQLQAGVSGQSSTTWERRGDTLVERTTVSGGFSKEVVKDAAGRVVARVDETGVTHGYAYDALGRLVRVATPDGTHALAFDGYGRPARVVRDGVATLEYAYDPVSGLLTDKRVHAPGGALERSVRTSYDAVGRTTHVEHRSTDGATQDFSYDWDGLGAEGPGVTPGQRGQLSRVRGPGYERRTRFDAAGREASSTLRLAGGWREFTTESSYRTDGTVKANRLVVRDGAGTVLVDSLREDQLDAHGRAWRRLVDGAELYRLVYDGEGRVERIELAGGTSLVFEHDPVTRGRRAYRVFGPLHDARVAWDFDPRGRVAHETVENAGQAHERAYTYDARGYLVDATDDLGQASYSYAASGLPETVADLEGTRTVRRTGDQLLVDGELYRWDALGRVVQKGELTLEYGANGEIAAARRPGREVAYLYDEAGQRVLKLVDGVPAAAYIGGAVLSEAGLVEPVVVDGVTVGVLEDGVFVPMITDARGTPVVDAAGATYLGTPYGVRAAWGDFAETIDFTRLGYDADLGTVRMGARDYDPKLSQFWTPDPKFLESLDDCAGSPEQCSLYTYAGGDPVGFVDRGGLDRTWVAPDHWQKVTRSEAWKSPDYIDNNIKHATSDSIDDNGNRATMVVHYDDGDTLEISLSRIALDRNAAELRKAEIDMARSFGLGDDVRIVGAGPVRILDKDNRDDHVQRIGYYRIGDRILPIDERTGNPVFNRDTTPNLSDMNMQIQRTVRVNQWRVFMAELVNVFAKQVAKNGKAVSNNWNEKSMDFHTGNFGRGADDLTEGIKVLVEDK